MQCDSGKYNSLASLFLQSPESTVKKLLHAPIGNKNNYTSIYVRMQKCGYYII